MNVFISRKYSIIIYKGTVYSTNKLKTDVAG